MDTVFRLHGLPEVIIFDRDPHFTGKFWESLFDLLGTDLRFNTAYHPQTDGQSERMIQTLENFLRPYVERNPQTWSQQLALAEFVANNASQCGDGTHTFLLTIWRPPHCTFSFDARRGWFEPSRSRAGDGGSDEDSPRGSADQSHHCAKSGEGLCRQVTTVRDISRR